MLNIKMFFKKFLNIDKIDSNLKNLNVDGEIFKMISNRKRLDENGKTFIDAMYKKNNTLNTLFCIEIPNDKIKDINFIKEKLLQGYNKRIKMEYNLKKREYNAEQERMKDVIKEILKEQEKMKYYEIGITDVTGIMIKEYDVINLFGGSGLEDLYIVKYSNQFQKFIYIEIEFYEECLSEKFYFKSTFDNRVFESDCRARIDVEMARARIIKETSELSENERCKVLKSLIKVGD